jgi:hypothetical protein
VFIGSDCSGLRGCSSASLRQVTLRYSTDLSAADWIVRDRAPWEQLVTFGPRGFAAYARLRFIPDPDRPGQAESDNDLAPDHPADVEQARRALERLQRFTTTPDDCYYCLWDGYGVDDIPAVVRDRPRVGLPHRQYFLLQGSLADFGGWGQLSASSGYDFPPAFAWPADHRWCLTRDVDPHWAGIGADEEAVDALLADPALDVVRARPDEPQPNYY